MQNWSLIYRALPKHLNSGSLENKKKNTRKNIFVGLTIFNRNKITFFNRTQSAVIRKKKILLLKTKDSTKRLHTFFFHYSFNKCCNELCVYRMELCICRIISFY